MRYRRISAARGFGSLSLVALLLNPGPVCSQTVPGPPRRADVIRHLSIYASPSEYCAWPSLARTSQGDLVVLFTRSEEHLGPDGAILLARSTDNGTTWLRPVVVVDSPIDDRESGTNVGANLAHRAEFISDNPSTVRRR